MVSTVLSTYGPNAFIAYDVGCSFKATVSRSSLGDLARSQNLLVGVPSWHGFSHNRHCQLTNHPLYLNGLGLEDGEGCERVFSRTNGCARVTRHNTKYHRKQLIGLTLEQWNLEKFANLGMRPFPYISML
jgi:hypothetical protein